MGRPGGTLNDLVKMQRFCDQAAWQHERAATRAGRGSRPPDSGAYPSSGVSHSAASGGRLSSAEWYWFIHGTSSVSTSPRLPMSDPP
jgi:hypothetical protein